MCAAGVQKYEVCPGDWYGPGTSCYIIRDLAALHQKRQSNLFRVHVSSEGTVYNDLVYELMTKEAAEKRRLSEEAETDEKEEIPHPLHPLDPVIDNKKPQWELKDLEWDTSLLLLIPHRLGRSYMNEKYIPSFVKTFSLTQSVGVLGGRPRGARWFYGAYSDGSKIFGLDPHTVQKAPDGHIEKKEHAGKTQKQLSVDLTDEYLASVHTSNPDILGLDRMDPSIAFGFYCRNRKDYLDLREALTNPNTTPNVVSFVDKPPTYDMSDDGMDMPEDGLDAPAAEDELSDEDDFVLL
eukprot:CAMPEP_0201126666 /NCGR_PEP_ID=MMETSP0850-20130426/27016_1 /ASSEMBLY_ACC=CAM_ASM_000622 /TAXON_ID=183588 /ORGANISM="Pseudo-nitzschia fraudulenta, Strain WWA7" /LENGTH=293 /DNA_ID=CAMNT_0047395189 /DNA_START=507 /DNA_END=1388 /DNA_ORIENTATION=-